MATESHDFDPTINSFIEPPEPKAGAERPYIEAFTVRSPTPPPICNDNASADVFVIFAAGLAIGLAVACAFSKATSVCDASV